MNQFDTSYSAALQDVLEFGSIKHGRNGRTRSLFNVCIVADMTEGAFPLLTRREMFYRGVFGEMAAFLMGTEFLQDYKDFGCNYWDANAKAWDKNKDRKPEDYKVGQYVGALWREFAGVDQLSALVQGLIDNPDSRRHVLSSWHPAAESCLPPCITMITFQHDNGLLNAHVTQRSADMCLGVPSDFIGIGLLLQLICREVGMQPGTLAFSLVDAHIYEQHVEGALMLLNQPGYEAPSLAISEDTGLFNFKPELCEIRGYRFSPAIKFEFVA